MILYLFLFFSLLYLSEPKECSLITNDYHTYQWQCPNDDMFCGNDMYECCITSVEPGNGEIVTTYVCKQHIPFQ